jgi:metal-sulfur cluster biosynthetic enzyme
MLKQDTIEVLRECDALLIPSGTKVTIQKGSLVMITQALGNSYTIYVNGNLARIAGKDGDALGMIILNEEDVNELDGTLEDKVWAVLKSCFDPEIPVNVVDLGLIYECHVTHEKKGNRLLAKPAAVSEVRGEAERRTGVYMSVHEDSSTASTKQFATAVGFCKKSNVVFIKMTLTAAGCGMGPVLVAEIEKKIRDIRGVNEVKVELVFDPPWNRNMMSDVAKLQLGML